MFAFIEFTFDSASSRSFKAYFEAKHGSRYPRDTTAVGSDETKDFFFIQRNGSILVAIKVGQFSGEVG